LFWEIQTFQNKRLAHAVNESTLDSLITELLLWLLDDRVPHMEDGSQLLKALNVLMLKILVRNFISPHLLNCNVRHIMLMYYSAGYLVTSYCQYRIMQTALIPLLS